MGDTDVTASPDTTVVNSARQQLRFPRPPLTSSEIGDGDRYRLTSNNSAQKVTRQGAGHSLAPDHRRVQVAPDVAASPAGPGRRRRCIDTDGVMDTTAPRGETDPI